MVYDNNNKLVCNITKDERERLIRSTKIQSTIYLTLINIALSCRLIIYTCCGILQHIPNIFFVIYGIDTFKDRNNMCVVLQIDPSVVFEEDLKEER